MHSKHRDSDWQDDENDEHYQRNWQMPVFLAFIGIGIALVALGGAFKNYREAELDETDYEKEPKCLGCLVYLSYNYLYPFFIIRQYSIQP